MNRNTEFNRQTKETKIKGHINLDGKGEFEGNTGIGFLDHMLHLFAFHGKFDLSVSCKGDLEVCPHHTIEDIAIAVGAAINNSLGDRSGIKRYSCVYLPMDETLTRTVIDISGRPGHYFKGGFSTSSIGEFPTEMVPHFFNSFAFNAMITLHQEILYGDNDHHRVESLFKGLGRSMAEAIDRDSKFQVPSTKGVL